MNAPGTAARVTRMTTTELRAAIDAAEQSAGGPLYVVGSCDAGPETWLFDDLVATKQGAAFRIYLDYDKRRVIR